ncbi:hypothetical protein LPJ53_002118 [Coemansia erecta]|uniref:VHS domain-containing protein n=1 Tax=Coemansia erecta TaxID=147472 RepID=A0A9W8CS57_9FUNG|nr:hypothetical protein LPJ53_002118 [Coemansia erecta]
MAVFSLHRSRLQMAMHDAITDPSAYDKVYGIIAKHRTARATAIEVTVDMVKKAVAPASAGKHRLLNRSDSSTPTSPTSPASSVSPAYSGITQQMPRPTLHAIAVLQVLHGIVLSFPTEMTSALAQSVNCARLLRLALSPKVPLDVRRALATLVARWHTVVGSGVARDNLALVVEGFCNAAGVPPDPAFLPRPPANVRTTLAAAATGNPLALYIPPGFSSSSTATGSAASEVQPEPRLEPEPKPVPSHAQAPQRELPPSPAENPALERMLQAAQELLATSSMIIDNLVALPLDDDPRTNPVIRELMASMGHLHRACVSDIARTMDTQATRRLKQSIDEAKRCQWIYNDSVRAYEVWRAQYGVAAEVVGDGSGSGGGGGDVIGVGQKTGSPALEPGGLTNGAAHDVLQRASTKARGKMADTSASD